MSTIPALSTPNVTDATCDDLCNYFTNVQIIGSHIATGLCLAGALANIFVLISVLRHRSKLVYTSPNNLAWIVTLMMIASVLNSVFIAVIEETWVFVDMSTMAADALSVVSYLLLIFLFTCNLLLSLERHWLVKRQTKMPWKWVVLVATFSIPFWLCIIASFILSDDDSWAFLPLGIPITNSVESGDYLNVSEPYGILFLVGLSYFPLVSLAICGIYENTYFLIADLYDDPDSRWFEDDRRLNKRTQLHRGVLLRCIIMSIFQLALYAPSIVMIFLSIWKPDIFDLSVKAAWLQFTAAVLPAADPLTTVIVILMFTNDFRAAFFSDCKLLWDVVSGRRKQSDQQSDVTLQAI